MSRRRNFVTIALLCLLLSPATVFAGHDFTQDECGSRCHTDPKEGEPVFLGDVDSLCLGCHTLLEKNVHPSLFAPGRSLPPEFWLDGEGRLNCATCHDPHPDTGSDPLMLRGESDGVNFCARCHDPGVPHKGVTFLAHSQSYTPPESGSGSLLDHVSVDCIVCHDTSDAASGVCVIGQQGKCGGHIVGLEYDKGDPRRLRPRSELSPYISLYEGKIGCASCHSIYSSEGAMLVIDNSGSALCLGCHDQ